MAHFMIAHLNDGQYGDATILQPETAAMMHAKQIAHHPELRGRAYGFSEWLENGHRAIFHDGGNPGFQSRLYLLPEANAGFYFVMNNDQYSKHKGFHRAFTTAFLDSFFPELPADQFEVVPMAKRPLTPLTGYYREVQAYSHDTLQKVDSLMNQFPIRGEGDTLRLFGHDYVAVEPLLFKNGDERSTVAFEADEQGNITYLFAGTGAFAKVPWYEAQPVQLGFAVWFVLIFIGGLVGSFFWHSAPTAMRVTLAAMSGLNLAFLVGMGVVLSNLDPWEFVYGLPTPVILLLQLPLIALLLVVVWLFFLWTKQASFASSVSVGLTAVYTLTILVFPLFLNFWNLLGVKV
jgi:hypothetical protein